MNRLYVCGPMTGIAEYNYPAFNTAAHELRRRGYTVENPADNTIEHPDAADAWEQYMRLALMQLVRVDGIALLSGWPSSRGAALEVYIATQLGLTLMPVADWCRAAPDVYAGAAQ